MEEKRSYIVPSEGIWWISEPNYILDIYTGCKIDSPHKLNERYKLKNNDIKSILVLNM